MRVKNSLKLKPYKAIDIEWTKISNSMIKYIEDVYAFKVYCYLCYRYNKDYDYAFPSLDTISEDCKMARSTVQKAIKYLEERRFIVRYKKKGKQWMNNCYYIRYVVETEEDRKREQERIVDTIEETLEKELEMELEIEIFLDENGNVIKEEKIKRED